MSIEYANLLAAMVAATMFCRVSGFVLGKILSDAKKVKSRMDRLPPIAMASVLGPQLLLSNPYQLFAFLVCSSIFLITRRFLTSFVAGLVVLMVLSNS